MAPCESCPPHCPKCAWDHTQNAQPKGGLVVIRTAVQYGCVKAAAIVVDAARQPFMRLDGKLHPLSAKFGGILSGTQLERDIAGPMALTVAA